MAPPQDSVRGAIKMSGSLSKCIDHWSSSYDGQCLYYPGQLLAPAALRAFINVVKKVGLTQRVTALKGNKPSTG
ncbi:hypothetical protein QO004_005906 [Rhizobium mesoamericanum]|nr:hypothetical protein [Rhizobium mesoamericanum]